MTRASRAGRLPALLVATALLAPALVACSGGGAGDGSGYGDPSEPSAGSGTPTPAEPQETDSPAFPTSVTPTEPGARLAYGDQATVAWQLPGGGVGVVDLRVDRVRAARRKEFRGWLGGQALEQARPYYVDVRVTNVGESDLGGHDVPLYLRDQNGTLGPPWAFDGTFEACPSGPLPASFAPEQRLRTCLVFLAPQRAEIEAMVFMRDADFEAITWTGEVTPPREAQKRTGKRGARKGRRSGER